MNNGIKEPTCGYQNYSFKSNIDIGWVCQHGIIYCVPIWVNAILAHVDTRIGLCRHDDLCMVYIPRWYWNGKKKTKKNPSNTHYLIGKHKCEILILDNTYVKQMIPTQDW